MPVAETGESAGCRCLYYLIFLPGFIVFSLWVDLPSTKTPKCSIEQFYLPALNNSISPQKTNTTLYFHLKLANPNKDKGIYYDALNITFYYQPTTTNNFTMIGTKTIPEFYQGRDKKANREDSVETRGVDWDASLKAVSNNQTVVFKVKVATVVKFKIAFWKSKKRRKINVGADVKVGGSGNKIDKKGIKLKSGASKSSHCHTPLFGALLISYYVLCS